RRDDVSPNLPRFFTSSSPLVTDGLCVAQVGGQGGGGITAFDLSTGEPKWKWTGDGAAYASPALLAVGDVKLVVALTADKIVAIGAADGKLVWETPFAPAQRSYNASTPVIDGATLIYGGGGRGFRAVKFEKQGDAIAAKELWSNSEKSPEFNSPVLRDGLLFALTKNHDFTCIDARDGKAAWTAPAGGGAAAGGGRNRGAGYGSIVDGGTVLLAVTPASELIVFSPDAKAYTEVARIKVASTPIYSHLVVSGNRLLVKDNDSLALFKVE
ncbi:MAG TPA: PQQ-binding-like beta-propeller repeat protein, partial [Planctomycetota bacterium]|nr:PQQ-binding-like beta-propeller repeat protein [Planctomycetota bacterium]